MKYVIVASWPWKPHHPDVYGPFTREGAHQYKRELIDFQVEQGRNLDHFDFDVRPISMPPGRLRRYLKRLRQGRV